MCWSWSWWSRYWCKEWLMVVGDESTSCSEGGGCSWCQQQWWRWLASCISLSIANVLRLHPHNPTHTRARARHCNMQAAEEGHARGNVARVGPLAREAQEALAELSGGMKGVSHKIAHIGNMLENKHNARRR
jgi:hypothetical protein